MATEKLIGKFAKTGAIRGDGLLSEDVIAVLRYSGRFVCPERIGAFFETLAETPVDSAIVFRVEANRE